MSRTIKLPPIDWSMSGHSVIIPVKVDWPELRLTDDQILANSIARADGRDDPYPDLSLINIEIQRSRC